MLFISRSQYEYDVSHNIIWKYIPSKEFSRSNTLKSLTHLNLYGGGESDDDLDQIYNDHPIRSRFFIIVFNRSSEEEILVAANVLQLLPEL